MDPTKLAAGAGAAVLIGGGGYGISALFDGGMPGYSPFKRNTSDANKYVDSYPDYFVDASTNSNDDWWDWVFKNRYPAEASSTLHGSKFRGVKSGAKGESSLKSKCSDVYAQDTNNVNTTATDEATKYFETDVWRYCTAVEKKPVLIQDAESKIKTGKKEDEDYGENDYGKAHKAKLVSAISENNKSFWHEQQRLFFKKGGERSGENAKGADDTPFKRLWKNQRGNLQDTCKGVYKTQKSNDNSDTNLKEDLFRFCSLKRSEN
ncbi:hypothetical protein [Candidatus Mycoplasma haematohominis]|uniref:Uncharacterized protein n=1 Tax=Candidatus Mycoplasma haematohominis TaxID=1494318 RepID=A0A478FTU8_9MOLU|nr:hypothetical protein [Candidatus Mycoplasma haemohominis]GCE63515.1 hypothetical protein MHSWG343_05120 [Candidatus Mycoplasma haemohominis]